MNDLRARIAEIIERDRAQHASHVPEDRRFSTALRSSLLATPAGASDGALDSTGRLGADARRGAPSRAPSSGTASAFEIREQRIALDDLGLEVVGRGACDALLLAHLGLKGDAPSAWTDILFLARRASSLNT